MANIIGLCVLAVVAIGLLLIGQFAPPLEPDPPKPVARPERDPLGEDIAGAIGGAFMLAVALVGLLVWLSPALILGWLVTR